MLKSQRIVFFSPLYKGTERDSQTFGTLLKNLFMIAIGFLGFVICLPLLYHAMRGVMDWD
jgi:dolichol kinase